MCGRCWQKDPGRPFRQAEGLAARLEDPPAWLAGFVAYAAARHCVGRTCLMITRVGRLLTDGGSTHPQALLERARRPGRSMGTLARTLEGFFVDQGLALPLDQAALLAAGRRERRVRGTPEPLRPAVARFAEAQLGAQHRARRAGTRGRSDRTIEANLAIVRDFARFLVTERGRTGWSTVSAEDVEAFLATAPRNRHTRLRMLRIFFRWARSGRVVLIDPTARLSAPPARGFQGEVLSRAEQRRLFRRWTMAGDAHPHECLVGVLALIHGASNAELRGLTVDAVDTARRTIRLGRRPHAVPLDPATWSVLQRALEHRAGLGNHNPHVVVTRITKTGGAPASEAYLAHVLDPAGVRPQVLRSTRLVDLVTALDPKVVSIAFGMDDESVLAYLADHVQDARLANL